MTGVYMLVNLEGVWVNVEIKLDEPSTDDVLKWIDFVGKELAKTKTLLESLVEEGILSKEANH